MLSPSVSGRDLKRAIVRLRHQLFLIDEAIAALTQYRQLRGCSRESYPRNPKLRADRRASAQQVTL